VEAEGESLLSLHLLGVRVAKADEVKACMVGGKSNG